MHAICVGFKVVPLKTHANTSKSSNQILKTHTKVTTGVFTRVLTVTLTED